MDIIPVNLFGIVSLGIVLLVQYLSHFVIYVKVSQLLLKYWREQEFITLTINKMYINAL